MLKIRFRWGIFTKIIGNFINSMVCGLQHVDEL
jgi:hypothetical protein